MIEVREAVEAAKEFAHEAFDGAEQLSFLRLEEIEMNSAGDQWKVTLGWVTPEDRKRATTGLANLTGTPQKLPRTYKTFYVDAESGEVRSMKIRDA